MDRLEQEGPLALSFALRITRSSEAQLGARDHGLEARIVAQELEIRIGFCVGQE